MSKWRRLSKSPCVLPLRVGLISFNHTAAILVEAIDFASLGFPRPRFEAFQNVANKDFYFHRNKHGCLGISPFRTT